MQVGFLTNDIVAGNERRLQLHLRIPEPPGVRFRPDTNFRWRNAWPPNDW